MLRSRFLWKSFAGYGAVILLTLAILGELVASGTVEDLRAKTEGLLAGTTGVAAEAVTDALERPPDTNPGAPLQTRVAALAKASGVRLAVISDAGAVLADSGASTVRGTNVGVLGEVLAARQGGIGWSVRRDSSGEDVLHCARRIDGSRGVLGFVRASAPIGGIMGRRATITRTILFAALAALVATFLLAWFHARVLERPLKEITRSVDAMSRGDFSRRLLVHENDTVGALAMSLNRLGAASRERMDMMATDRNKVVAILASVVEGVVAVDSSERVVHMNQAAARILGTHAGRAHGRRLWEMTRVREVSEMLATTLRTGEEVIGEVRVVTPPRDRWVELRATPLHDADSAIAGAVVMLHDVTELRRLEAIRRDFVANVSHELKTPITAIRGMVETVLDDSEMEPEMRRRFLARIKEQSFRLSQLVSDLLTLSRLESDSQLGELSVLDFADPDSRFGAGLVADRGGPRDRRRRGRPRTADQGGRRDGVAAARGQQPGRQRAEIQPGGRPRLGAADGRGRLGGPRGGGRRHRHRAEAPRPDLPAVLPGRQGALAGARWHRSRAVDRQARLPRAPRRSGRRQLPRDAAARSA